nr:hypothetical protein [Tanacetum cinerariifolium]
DNSPRIHRNAGYESQRSGNVAGARETVGSSMKPKGAKDAAYHREKMLLCKQEEAGIQLNAEQADWKDDTDDEYDDQELEAHYMYMAIRAEKIARIANPFALVAQQQPKPKRAMDTAYHREKILLCKQEEAGIQLNAEQADWRDDSDDDDELEDQELEAHYMYMAQLQEVSLDAADSGPIFDAELLQKVSNDDHYNVFAIESTHPEQSKYVLDTYPIKQDAHNVIIDSLDMSYNREEIDQNDDADLAEEHELLASLIEKLKCEIDETKIVTQFWNIKQSFS